MEKRYKEAGGVEGIGTTASNLVSLFKGGSTATTGPSDYDFGLQPTTPGQAPANQGSTPSGVFIVGGVVLVGAVLWGLSYRKKQQLN